MAERDVVETVYGKQHKYEIVRVRKVFGDKFDIYRDGKYHRGEFSSLRDAVEAATKES